jgi:hypothetical protein
MASVIDVTFLSFTTEREAAGFAGDEPPVDKTVALRTGVRFTGEDALHAVKQRLADQRRVDSLERLLRSLETNQAHIEGVVEDFGKAVYADAIAGAIPEAAAMQLIGKRCETVFRGPVEFERDPNEWCPNRVRLLRAARASIKISDGGR